MNRISSQLTVYSWGFFDLTLNVSFRWRRISQWSSRKRHCPLSGLFTLIVPKSLKLSNIWINWSWRNIWRCKEILSLVRDSLPSLNLSSLWIESQQRLPACTDTRPHALIFARLITSNSAFFFPLPFASSLFLVATKRLYKSVCPSVFRPGFCSFFFTCSWTKRNPPYKRTRSWSISWTNGPINGQWLL